ncbi:CD1871A family CXXC motif-containing protein [Paraclostridium bifermentans]|nr:CD1871A family CXXC motif-containing protein [Paraclostridium bifermentans]
MKKINHFTKYFLLLTSICFICMGVIRQEQFTVLKKSIKICLECIGVG